jgi:peroxiredoxin
MRIYKILIGLLALLCLAAVCFAENVKTNHLANEQLKDYELEIVMHNCPNADEVWMLTKCIQNAGVVPIDINTDEKYTTPPSLFKANGGKFVIKGKIKEAGLYFLRNARANKSFPFMIEAGKLKLEINYEDLSRKKDKFEIVPFKHKGSKLNDELINFWSSEGMKNYSKEYGKYLKWYHSSIESLWGITTNEYFKRLLSGGLAKMQKERKITNSQKEAISEEQAKRLKSLNDLVEDAISNYIIKHPKSLVGLEYLGASVYAYGYNRPKLRKRWEHLQMIDEDLRHHTIYKALSDRYNRLSKVRIGDLAPDFELKNTQGNNIKLSDLRGNFVLVEFWKSDCDYCKNENENLHRLCAKYQNEDFEIISVSFDKEEADWRKALSENGNTWLNVRESKGFDNSPIVKNYVEASVPYYFLLDKEGKFLAKNLRHTSFAPDKDHDLNVQLEKIMSP